MASGMPEDGKLICLDISEDYTNVGKKYWKEAGVDQKIELRLGDGVETLGAIFADESNHNTFDFAYLDADKSNYPLYYETLVRLLRPGGFLMMDNTLWRGHVADPEQRHSGLAKAIYEVIEKARMDDRVWINTLQVSDGFTIVHKK